MARMIVYADSYRDGKMMKVKKGMCTVTGEWFESAMILDSWTQWLAGEKLTDVAPYLTPGEMNFWNTHLTPAEKNGMMICIRK